MVRGRIALKVGHAPRRSLSHEGAGVTPHGVRDPLDRWSSITARGKLTVRPKGSLRLFEVAAALGSAFKEGGDFTSTAGTYVGVLITRERRASILKASEYSQKSWDNWSAQWVKCWMAHRCDPGRGRIVLFTAPRESCPSCHIALEWGNALPQSEATTTPERGNAFTEERRVNSDNGEARRDAKGFSEAEAKGYAVGRASEEEPSDHAVVFGRSASRCLPETPAPQPEQWDQRNTDRIRLKRDVALRESSRASQAIVRRIGIGLWTWEPINAVGEVDWTGILSLDWNQHGGVHRSQAEASDAMHRALGLNVDVLVMS
jgi:hypothetical protein